MTLRVLDLFSGIGGFALGLERAGMQTVAFSEIERYPSAILAKHWPDVPNLGDVRQITKGSLDKHGIGSIDVICGGYPCQPFSLAGERAGEEDDRHLWPEYFRLVCELRPQYVLCENVYGHISLGIDSVLSDLEGEGYATEAFVIPACALGAWHRRDRVWIIGYTDHGAELNGAFDGDPLAVMFAAIADAHCSRYQEREGEDAGGAWPEQWAEPGGGGIWDVEPGVGRMVDGLPGRVDRVTALGNAVVPQLATAVGLAVRMHHQRIDPG